MLFGHQNDDTNQPGQDAPAATDMATPPPPDSIAPSADGVNPLAVDPETGASLPTVTNNDDTSALDQPSSDDSSATAPVIEPTSPFTESAPTDLPAPATPESVAPAETPAEPTPEPSLARSSAAPAPAGSDDLLSLKQQALTQLSPLISQLDQTPEERFRTTMMLIQSTDNQALIKDAYDAAQSISDEKTRAQALLDVVNEINYFTQAKPGN